MAVAPGTERKCKRCGMALVYLEGKSGPEHCMPAQNVRAVYRREGDHVVKIAVPPGADELFVNHFETCPHASHFSRSSKGSQTTEPPAVASGSGDGLVPTDDAIVQGRLALFDHDLAERLRDAGIREGWNNADPDWKERSRLAGWDCMRARRYFIVDHLWLYIPMEYETHCNKAIAGVLSYARKDDVKWCEKTTHHFIPSARAKSHHNLRPIFRSLIYQGTEPDDGGWAFRASYMEEVEKFRARRRAERREERRRRGDD